MTWEQKFAAIKALSSRAALSMRAPGDWFVSHGVEVKERHTSAMLCGIPNRGETPEQAVEDCWKKLTTLEPTGYLVLNAYRDDRRHVRWNGFMWEDVSHIYATRSGLSMGAL